MQTCIWLNHRSSQEADALIPVTVSCTYPHGVSTWTYTYVENRLIMLEKWSGLKKRL